MRQGAAAEANATTIAWQRDWQWTVRRPWGLAGELSAVTEVAIGYWDARASSGGETQNAWRFGITPILRYSFNGPRGWFAEVGIGANLITPLYRAGRKRFSTVFNFGDHLGIGWRSAGLRGWHWALRYEHFSNAGIKEPNPGQDFVQIEIGFEF